MFKFFRNRNRTFKRLKSLEEFLGVLYCPEDEYGDGAHLPQEDYGFVSKLTKLLKEHDKKKK